jgi:uncharacterized membrane protein
VDCGAWEARPVNNAPQAALNAFLYGELLIVGGLFHLIPQLTRPEIFFAVTVPSEFRRTPAGREILRKYRAHVWLHTLGSAGLLTFGLMLGNEIVMLSGLYWQMIGGFLSFQAARRNVMPHGVTPSSQREARLAPRASPIPGAALLHLGPFALLGASALYLRAHWNEIPPRFPVHWGLNGQPNGWASRTLGGVYGPQGGGALLCAMLILIWYGILYGTRQVQAAGPAARNEAKFRRIQLLCLLSAEYLLAFTFTWASLLPLRSTPGSSPPGFGLFLLGTLVYICGIVALLLYAGQGGTRLARSSEALATIPGAAPAGDRTLDNCWKLGLLYVNRDDPAIVVEKRFGIGYTLNLGHPLTWVVLAVMLLVVVLIPLLSR